MVRCVVHGVALRGGAWCMAKQIFLIASSIFLWYTHHILHNLLDADNVMLYLAEVVELVDTLDSKSSGSNTVGVRFPPSVSIF